MCITKRAVKNAPQKDLSKEKKASGQQAKKPGKKFKIPTFAKKKSKEPPVVEEKILEKPEEEPKVSEKEEEKPEEVEEKKEVVKQEVQKEPPRRPSPFRPNCANLSGLSGTTRKKAKVYKYGQIDREELSINNDKTEFLENAQLTKLMSHADMKALMNGQNAPGENGDDQNCQDTVEEVDSEMQDIAFSPLLAVIPKEDDKPYGALAHPADR